MAQVSRFRVLATAALAATCVAAIACRGTGATSESGRTDGTATATRGPFVRSIRVAGTVEAVRASTSVAPRLRGQNTSGLVVTRLVAGGSRVRQGDVLVEFDRQEQVRIAFDRRAEVSDLDQQIRRRLADQSAARAADGATLKQAENDVTRARLTVTTNRILPKIEAEKNDLALEQALARLAQLTETFALKRTAAAADLRILEIRRARAQTALENAESNAGLMVSRAAFDGLAVLKNTFKGSQMLDFQEGDEVRSGTAVVDVVDPSQMRVRIRVCQADAGAIAPGQPVRIALDAYPGLAFDGRVETVAPLAVPSQLTAKVRTFMVLVSISGTHPSLMPDLSAAADVVVERLHNVLTLPRESVVFEPGGAWVLLQRGRSFERTPVTVTTASARLVVIGSGLTEGAIVARRPQGGS
jgi:HlyD family secretion protein